MSILVFGKGDRIAVDKPRHHASVFGSGISYSNPNMDWCYSKHGFAIPLTYEALPYEVLVENKFPELPDTMSRFPSHASYMLVDPAGMVWYAFMGWDDGVQKMSFQHVYNRPDTWWVRCSSEEDVGPENEMLVGFLKSNPTEEAIEAFLIKRHQGQQIVWMSISDIVETINRNSLELLDKTLDVILDKSKVKSDLIFATD